MQPDIVIEGFRSAGVACGLKKNGKKDLGLILSDTPASVAGVFTRNRVQAAPVLLDRRRIADGVCRAVVVNSGNANCCTGTRGRRDAETVTAAVAAALQVPEAHVLAASTGVIGEPLPVERICRAVPGLVERCRPEGLPELAEAIMTTDTMPKLEIVAGAIDGKPFRLAGVAKGAGMIRPDMATMLCFVLSDVRCESGLLQKMLRSAVDRSFNRITVDGDTSTNDTVLVMTSGTAAATVEHVGEHTPFQQALDDLLMRLARACVKDGEGATKLVEICVKGAGTDAHARRVAETIANSSLVKTALFGEDANWGRILAAAGRAGVDMEPDRVDLFFDNIQMVSRGAGCGKEIEAAATAVLKKPEFTITVDLNAGPGRSAVLTCDLSLEYVRINADYRT